MSESSPTPNRLINEGMRLFAEQGFHATSVGEIEAAAGLQPRRGALYRHFASKQALLEAAVRTSLDSAAKGAVEIGGLDFNTIARDDQNLLRSVLTGLARWFLDEMDKMKDLTLLLEHDGQRLPDLTNEIKQAAVDLSYRTAARLIAETAAEATDSEATSVILLGSLVAIRRTTWTFGSPPLDIDDDRAIAAWTNLALATFEQISTPSPTSWQ